MNKPFSNIFKGLLLIILSAYSIQLNASQELNANFQYDEISLERNDDFEVIEEEGVNILLQKGIDYMQIQEYHLAYKYLQLTKAKAEDSDSTRVFILALNNLGNLFYYLNNADSALFFLYYALDIAEKSDFFELQNSINNNIGIIYSSTEHNAEAKVFFEKALAVSILVQDSFKIAINLSNLGAVKTDLNDLNGAESNLMEAKRYFSQINETGNLLSVYTSLGAVFFKYRNFPKSLEYYSQVLELTKSGVHTIDKPNIYINIGKVYFELNENKLAKAYLDSAYDMSMLANNLNSATNTLHWLSQVHVKNGDYKNALYTAERAIELKDSIIKQEKRDLLEQSSIKYEFNVKAREYDLLKRESEIKKFYWRIIAAALLSILILVVIVFRMKLKEAIQNRKKIASEHRIAKDKLDYEQSKNKELETKLETINYELISQSILIDNKNQVLDNISNLLDKADYTNSEVNHLHELKQHLYRDNIMDKNLDDFRLYFEKVHTNFFKNLHHKHPQLSSTDLRLCAFLILQFNSKEVAEIFNITTESVRKRKQRLREKLGLDSGNKLLNYLFQYIQQ